MAPATIPKPPSSSPRASAHVDGPSSDHGAAAALTPTRPIARSTSPPPTVRIVNRDARQSPRAFPWPIDDDPFCEAGGMCGPLDRPASHDNTGDSTIQSQENSLPWSGDGSDLSSDDDDYYSPPAAPLKRYLPVPPPHPLPLRGAAGFPPPPPWQHPSDGPLSRRPPISKARDMDWTSSDSESEDSDVETRSLSGDGGRRRGELGERLEDKQRCVWQLRQAMVMKRRDLKELRRRMDSIDNALMQIFRPHLTSGLNDKSRDAVISIDVLGERLGEMQRIRDEYYTAESAYEVMETDLDHEEIELRLLEGELFRIPWGRPSAVRQTPIPPPPPTMKAQGTVEAGALERPRNIDDQHTQTPLFLLGISADRPEDIHPLYQELLEAAGDRKLAEEYVEDLEVHRDKVLFHLEMELHRKRVREEQGNQISEEDLEALRSSLATAPTDAGEFEGRFGISITDDELECLRDYKELSTRARKALDSASENLAHLRDLCLKKGVMRKHASYHEELAIYSGCPGWSPLPLDGNMSIDPPHPPHPFPPPSSSPDRHAAAPPPSLAHPRFPILLSNPSHVLERLSPLQALERALQLPQDDPAAALRRAECMKELGISTLMTKAASTPDFINQWLIHRLRTSPLEAELLLAVCEGRFRVANLRRWQEDVLHHWRLDEAATVEAELFERRGASPSREGEGLDGDGHGSFFSPIAREGSATADHQVNSVIEDKGRVRSEEGDQHHHHYTAGGSSPALARSVWSLG